MNLVTFCLLQDCYRYSITQTVNVTSILMNIQVSSAYIQGQFMSSDALSLIYARLGDQPSVTISNQTHTMSLDTVWNSDLKLWQASISISFVSASAMSCWSTVKSTHVSFAGCSVSDTLFDNTINYLNQLPAQAIIQSSNDLAMTSMKIYSDSCSPKHSIATFGSQSAIVTSDSFGPNSTWVDFKQSSVIKQLSTTVNFTTLLIHRVALMNPSILILTNLGMFEYSLGGSLQKLSIPLATNAFKVVNSADIFTSVQCANSVTARKAFFVASVNSFRDAVLTSNGIVTWTAGLNMTQNGANMSIVSVVRNFATGDDMYLLGLAIHGCCGLSDSCCYNNSMLFHNYDSIQTPLKVVFAPSDIVIGMVDHGYSGDILVFGSSLWKSATGYAFRPQVTLSKNEYFVEVKTSVTSGEYVAQTNFDRYFYGTAESTQLVNIPFSTSSASSNDNLPALYYTVSSSFSVLDLSEAIFTSGNQLLPANGNTLDPTTSSISKKQISIPSFLSNLTVPFNGDLVPVFVNRYETRYYAKGDALTGVLVGMELTHESTSDTATVTSVADDSMFLTAYASSVNFLGNIGVASRMGSPTLFLGPLSLNGNIVQANGNATVQVVNPISGATYWTIDNIGATIMFRHPSGVSGSFYITSITNSSTLSGTLVAASKIRATLDTQNGSSGLLLRSWKVDNFGRNYLDFVVKVYDVETLTLASSVSGGGFVTATISGTNKTFMSQGKLMHESLLTI